MPAKRIIKNQKITPETDAVTVFVNMEEYFSELRNKVPKIAPIGIVKYKILSSIFPFKSDKNVEHSIKVIRNTLFKQLKHPSPIIISFFIFFHIRYHDLKFSSRIISSSYSVKPSFGTI